MARVFIPDVSKLAAIKALVEATWEDAGLTMHLFKNTEVVDAGSVLGDFIEADYDGYTALTNTVEGFILADGTFDIEALKAQFETPQTYMFAAPGSGSQVVYGFYLTFEDADDGTVMLAACNSFDENPEITMSGYEQAAGGPPLALVFSLFLWDTLEPGGSPALTVYDRFDHYGTNLNLLFSDEDFISEGDEGISDVMLDPDFPWEIVTQLTSSDPPEVAISVWGRVAEVDDWSFMFGFAMSSWGHLVTFPLQPNPGGFLQFRVKLETAPEDVRIFSAFLYT